jgi:hypothetical protein
VKRYSFVSFCNYGCRPYSVTLTKNSHLPANTLKLLHKHPRRFQWEKAMYVRLAYRVLNPMSGRIEN